MFGNRRMYDTRSDTELSSAKFFAASLGLVAELRLGLVLGIITDVSSGTYIDACSYFVPELSLGLELRASFSVRSETCSVIAESTIRVQSPSFLRGNTSLLVWGSSPN